MIRSLLVLLASCWQLLGASYYVTQSGAGSHDGISSANAWSVAEFNGTTKPTGGDVVFFSGTLTSGLSPSANGTFASRLVLDCKGATLSAQVSVNSKNYLTLLGGTTSSGMTSGTAIRLDRATYITLDGWTFKSSDINGWPTFVYSTYCSNLEFRNCTVDNCGYAFLGQNDDTILITGCDIRSSQNGTTNIGNQTDLIHGGGWQGVTIEKSKWVLRAPGSAKGGSDGSYRHNDVLQNFATGGSSGRNAKDWIIRYCWIENANTTGDGNSSWLMVDSQGGYFKIYGNVWVSPSNASGISNGLHMGSGKSQGDQHVFYNNTVVKKGNAPGNAISYNDANKPAGQGNGTLSCVNNIAYSGGSAGSTANNFKVGQISNNFWYNFSAAASGAPAIPPGPGGSSMADPKFVDFAGNDFSLAAGSPCRGAGVNTLGSEYNQGIAPGSTWPNPRLVTRSGAWDVGAYVSNAGPAPSPTPSPNPSPTPTPSPTPSPTPGAKFAVGDYVTPSVEVNVRSTPAGALLGTHAVGEVGTVKAGPEQADLNGLPVDWYDIDWPTVPNGWSGDDNLVLSESPPPVPTPTPTPTPSPTPSPSPSPTPGAPTYEKWIENQNNWIRANPPKPD